MPDEYSVDDFFDPSSIHYSGAPSLPDPPTSPADLGSSEQGAQLLSLSRALTSITLLPGDDIQKNIDKLSALGGGILNLQFGTFNVKTTITVPSGVTLSGISESGTVIDFNGTAAQILIQGSSAYSTGTITVTYGSTAVAGVGTTWNSSMVGQSILLGDYWYTIAAVGGAGALTLDSAFIGTDLAADTYVIATTVSDVTLQNLTLTNASGTLLRFRYVNGMNLNTVGFTSGGQAIDGDDSANINLQDGYFVDSCTVGITYDNVPFCIFKSGLISNITGGTGLALTRVTNTALDSLSIQSVVGVGAKLTTCSNFGFSAFSIIECTSHGMELVSGNNDVDMLSGYVNKSGGDGIKLTATSDRNTIVACSFINNTGYGINIAAATCDDNKIIAPAFSGNGSGTVNDSGTTTFIAPQTFSGADVQTFNASGTWTKPSGAKIVLVQAWGGGGGGGSATTGAVNGSSSAGGGGGGGSYSTNIFNASDLSATETVTIAAAAATGAVGGTTTLGTHLSAFGGGAGANAANNQDSGGGGGAGLTAAGVSSVSAAGSNGGAGGAPAGSAKDVENGGFGGAGGGSNTGAAANDGKQAAYGGGSGGAGSDITVVAGGSGGNSVYGAAGGGGGHYDASAAAGAGGTSRFGGNGGGGGQNTTGTAGTAPGGGGGGAGRVTAGAVAGTNNGGTGALGRVIVTTYT